MPGVSRSQIERAREIDLLSYLQTYEPDSIRQTSANEYCLAEHDSLKISNNKWHWFSHGFGGKDALTFLVKVRNMDFVDAVLTLCNERAPPVLYSQPITPPKPKSTFVLPTPDKDNFRVITYLLNRGIDREIINRCIGAGTLYQSKSYGNCVFVGKDRDNTPRFACMRSTINNFRQDIENSDKKYCFNIPSTDPDARFALIAEAPIDILSLATMRKMDTSVPDRYHYLALAGTSTLALSQYLTDHPKIDHVIVCLDNDTAGRKCADRIKEAVKTDEMLKNRHIFVITEPPPTGKDFNDSLIAIREKQKAQTKTNRSKEADIFI